MENKKNVSVRKQKKTGVFLTSKTVTSFNEDVKRLNKRGIRFY